MLITSNVARDFRLVGLLAVAIGAGCSNQGSENAEMLELGLQEAAHSRAEACSWHKRVATVGDRRIPYTPATDGAFIEFFIEHHEMAVMMAEHEVAHGDNNELKLLAQEMIEMQSAEIESMHAIGALLSKRAPTMMAADPHAAVDMEHMSTLRGSELDAMFLNEMIAHHAAGLPVAHRSLATLGNKELRTLAAEMTKAQATEIGEMQAWRERLQVQGAGEDLPPTEVDRADMGIVGDRRISFTPANDIEFIDFFAPHHMMAIEMAELVISHGQDAEVKRMAEQARDAQHEEVEAMRDARESLTGMAESPALPRDWHTQREMAEMRKLNGLELDRMFLREMIPHHAAGIPTAHRAKPHVQDAELRAMADRIFAAQSDEVGEMQRMLDGMP